MADSWERFIVNVSELQAFYNQILTVRAECSAMARKTRDLAWLQVESEVGRIQSNFARQLDEIARITAVDAQRMIVAKLKSAIVRPPTGNRPGLQDVIWCTPVSTGPFSFGQVEIAHLDKLDQAINPDGGRTPYWRAQEFGTSANIGRVIHGMFTGAGGSSLPSQLEFRQHPLFTPGPGGKGTINRPIPAKHFLRDGTDEAKAQWLAMVATAVNGAAIKLRTLKLPGVP